MAECIHIQLKAEGQGLALQAPSPIASDSLARLVFDVEFSEEWGGFDAYHVAQKRGAVVALSPVENGSAFAADALLETAGRLEIALVATRMGERLTTERRIIDIAESNL